MKLAIIISSFIIVHAGVVKQGSDVVKINGICYEKELLTNDLDSYSIPVDYASNTIYYRYKSNSNGGKPGGAAKLDINTKEVKRLDGVGFGFSEAVDQKTHNVYFSVDHAISKYDPNTDKVESLGQIERGEQHDLNAWSLFFKDTLYYTTFASGRVFTFADGKSTRFEDMKDTTADTFIIDNEDDMFYTNKTGLYSQKKGTKDAVLYREFSKHDDDVGKGLTMDVNGKVYVCLDSGIFAVNKATKELEKLIDFDEYEGYGIAFDRDNNMIYGASNNLYRLKPNKDKTC